MFAPCLIGDLELSRKVLQQVLDMARATKDRASVAFAQYKLADVAMARGNLGEARRLYQDAESVFNEIEDTDDVANDHLSMAELEIEEADLAAAETTARQAIQYFLDHRNSVGQLTGQGVLAEVLIAKRDIPGAQKALAPILSAPRNPNRVQDMSMAPVIARVQAAAGKPAEALRNLKTSLSEAEHMKCVAHSLQQRLALGQIEMESGQESTGRAHLQALEKDATAKSFLLIANKANKARTHQPS